MILMAVSLKANRRKEAKMWTETMAKAEMWDKLEDLGVSEQTIQIVTDINGYTEETLCDILYAYSGYRSFDQLDY